MASVGRKPCWAVASISFPAACRFRQPAAKEARPTARPDTARKTKLKCAGLLQRFGASKGGARIGIRLTVAGDEIARSLCGLPPLDWALEAMDEIYAISQTEEAIDDRGHVWIAEELLVCEGVWEDALRRQAEGDAKEVFIQLGAIELMLLPALWRGLVLSNADSGGHVYYRLSPAGLAIAESRARGEPQPASPLDLPAAQPEAAELYNALSNSAIEGRQQLEAGRILYDIPLSASLPNRQQLRKLRDEQAAKKQQQGSVQ